MQRLELWLPVKPFHLNQPFGGNIPCVPDTPDVPVAQRKVVSGADNNTCPAGYVKLYALLGLPNGHNGDDLAAGEQPCYSSLEGVVTEISTEPARGLGVGITSQNEYAMDGYGVHHLKVRYWHLKEIKATLGQVVKVGDLIGITDNTGYSSRNHCHWEGKPQDFVNGQWVNSFQDNGFYGAIDLMPFCNMFFAQDQQTVMQILAAEISILQRVAQLWQKLAAGQQKVEGV